MLVTYNLSFKAIDSGILLGTFRRVVNQDANYPGLLSPGVPRKVLVDAGAENQGLFRETLTRLGVEVSVSSGYHPERNGREERLIQTVQTEVLAALPGYAKLHKRFDPYAPAEKEQTRRLGSLKYEPYRLELPVTALLTPGAGRGADRRVGRRSTTPVPTWACRRTPPSSWPCWSRPPGSTRSRRWRERGIAAAAAETDEAWLEEAVRNTPMFQSADMWVTGSGRHLSPLQFLAFTQEPRADLDGLSIEDFGLTEERCTRVDKRGVEAFTHFYTSGELQAYLTGDRQSPQRDTYIRYDRALAARGVLETMEFLVRDDQGQVIDRILLHRQGSPAVEASRDDIMRSRNAFVHALLKTRSNKEVAYMGLLGDGLSLADKLMADSEARRRFQKNNPPPPMPATPIVDGEDQEAKSARERPSGGARGERLGGRNRARYCDPARGGTGGRRGAVRGGGLEGDRRSRASPALRRQRPGGRCRFEPPGR